MKILILTILIASMGANAETIETEEQERYQNRYREAEAEMINDLKKQIELRKQERIHEQKEKNKKNTKEKNVN